MLRSQDLNCLCLGTDEICNLSRVVERESEWDKKRTEKVTEQESMLEYGNTIQTQHKA